MRLTGIKAAVCAAVVALVAATPASAWWRGYYGWGWGGWNGWGTWNAYWPYYGYGYAYPYTGTYAGYYPAYGGYAYSAYPTYPSPYYTYSTLYPSPVYSGYTASYVVPQTTLVAAPAGTTTQSFYPPTAESATPNPNEAVVRVTTAPDAQLWFDGVATTQKGPVRTFGTPELTPGHNYKYDVRVRWMDNGTPVERNRTVQVGAGRTVNVDLTPDALR